MKKSHKVGVMVKDDAFSVLTDKAGRTLSTSGVAAEILHAGIEAIVQSGRFTLPLRLKVVEDAAERPKIKATA